MAAHRRAAPPLYDSARRRARRAPFRPQGESRAHVRARSVHRRRQARRHRTDRSDICRAAPTVYRAAPMTITKAIILSAGQGSRLLPLTRDIPKCLIEFTGRSLISWQVAALVANGIKAHAVVTVSRHEAHNGQAP